MGNSESQDLNALVNDAIARVIGELAAMTSATDEADLTAGQIAGMIDHTALKAETVESQIRTLCDEAGANHFASVCVNPTWVPLCAELLADGDVMVCTVIGFPLGANTVVSKAFEAADAVAGGAQEVDMVINIGRLLDGDWQSVYDDVAAVADAAHAGGAALKVILETCLLTDEQKIAGSILSKAAGADFVKTSTGFNSGGATVADIRLMRATVGPELGVKASGGMRTVTDVRRMAAAGATRIGASAGVAIMQDLAGVSTTASADGDDY